MGTGVLYIRDVKKEGDAHIRFSLISLELEQARKASDLWGKIKYELRKIGTQVGLADLSDVSSTDMGVIRESFNARIGEISDDYEAIFRGKIPQMIVVIPASCRIGEGDYFPMDFPFDKLKCG